MRTRVGRFVGLLAVGALLPIGCGGGGPGVGGGEISGDAVVLGVLNDQSGIYADVSGKNSVVAVQMAVEDFRKAHPDSVVSDIEVIGADHQNKPDLANAKAAELYDRQQADVILDVPTSSAALAVANVADQKSKLHINVSAGTTELTGESCNKHTFHYAFDTYMLAYGTGTTLTENGAENWYIVYPDYAYGQDMRERFTAAIENAGGRVVGQRPDAVPERQLFDVPAPGAEPEAETGRDRSHAGRR